MSVRFLLLVCFLLSVLLSAYAEPPIEVIYWQASDVATPSQKEIDRLNEVMSDIQTFFASEMERHGFGPKTFAFKNIEVVKGKKRLSQYTSHLVIQNEASFIERGLDNQIYVVFFGGSGDIGGNSAVSQQLCQNIPAQLKYCNNLVVMPTESKHTLLPILAHEIGHAFGLEHIKLTRMPEWIEVEGQLRLETMDVMIHPLPVPGVAHRYIMRLREFLLSRRDAVFLDAGGRLRVRQDSQAMDTEIALGTDVNNDGYTDLSDCLIVRSAISIESNYDTDVNNDGVTNILDLMLVKAVAFEAIAAAAPSLQRGKPKVTTTWGALKQQ